VEFGVYITGTGTGTGAIKKEYPSIPNIQLCEPIRTGPVSFNDVTISVRSGRRIYRFVQPATIRIIGDDDWPSSGSLRGADNNGSATITAQSNTAYQLDVDTDNDDSADYTVTGLWNQL
jgi:hypothetical protein